MKTASPRAIPIRSMRRLRLFVTRAAAFVTIAWIPLPVFGGRAVLVYEDGLLESQPSQAELSPEKLGEVHHAWVWSNQAVPRRVGPEDILENLTPASEALTINLSWPIHDPLPPIRLFAAPLEMWSDIPESLLPGWTVSGDRQLRIPVDHSRPWRIRAAAEEWGSWWVDVAPGRTIAQLTVVAAAPRRVRIVEWDGQPLAQARLSILSRAVGRGNRPTMLAKYEADDKGLIYVPSLPDVDTLTFLALTGSHTSTVLSARITTLPEELRLSPGFSIHGRFVDVDKKPVIDAYVRAEAWVSDQLAASIVRQTRTDGEGRWTLNRLPLGRAAVTVFKEGLVPFQKQIDLRTGGIDLGQILLQPGISVSVLVVDDMDQPVAGASVVARPGIEATSDAEGRAQMRPLSGSAPLRLSASADGHLPLKKILVPPIPAGVLLRMQRAFRVEGRLVDARGLPISEGLLRIQVGTSYQSSQIEGSGDFSIDLEPRSSASLVFRSPTTEDLRVDIEAGAAGETRNLGDLILGDGFQVSGVVIRDDGLPVIGARIWCPRSSEQGDIVSWVHEDLILTTSNEAGEFEVSGLPKRPALLRIDAPGLARAHVSVDPNPEAPGIDVGTVVLTPGVTVAIWAGDEAERAVARVDLRNLWLEPDMLTSTIYDGHATVEHVPPGEVTVSVLKAGELLCEDTIYLSAEDGFADYTCQRSTMHVTGTVAVGGRMVGPGDLLWMPERSTSAPSIVMNFSTRSGLEQQQAFGGGRPDVRVEVDPSGSFMTDVLRPGRWEVTWLPSGGRSLPVPLTVVVPQIDSYEAHLSFSSLAVSGMVLDQKERPVENARVRDVSSGAEAFSGPDGRFLLSNLAPGLHVIFARFRSVKSSLADVYVQPENPPDEVLLVIEEPDERLEILTLDHDDNPIAGAFIVLESEAKDFQLLTSGRGGRTSLPLLPPYPKHLRAAVFKDGCWTFGVWRDMETLRKGWTIYATNRSGSARFESKESRGYLSILSAEGWNVSKMFERIGTRLTLSPEQPIEVRGLPEGAYVIQMENQSLGVTVREDDMVDAEFR